ncbi:MAG TPA: hypothetical protein VI251_16960 [Pseudolabrys sp.]
MKATKATEHQDSARQDSERQKNELDNRYGKIGISAVAAAVHQKGEKHPASDEPRRVPYDRD